MTDDKTRIQIKPAPDDATQVNPNLPTRDDDRTRIKTQSHADYTQPRTLGAGDTIKDRFILDRLLGQGGMGSVYRALDLRKKEAGDNKPYVAIKLLGDDFKNHPEALVTLQREARKTQELAHPNIVTVYDFDRDGDVIYLTMEELKGQSLAEVINSPVKTLTEKQQLTILQQIAQGLAYAHSKGIVHSDLKPGNIFLTENDQIKILDFGIARAANTDIYEDTFDAGDLGALTMSYASLEMITQQKPHPSDDIYALGIIACQLLGQGHPFKNKDAQSVLKSGMAPQLPAIKNPFMRRMLLRSLALKREHRIQDATQFLKQLKFARTGAKRFIGIAVILLCLIIGNLYYLKIAATDEINFNDLPPAAQQEFKNHINEAQTALQFGDLQGAVVNVDQAFAIHKTHKDLIKLRETIVKLMTNNIAAATDDNTRQFAQQQLDQLNAYPAFAIDKQKP